MLSTNACERDAGLALLRVLIGDPLAGDSERRLGETLYAEVLHSGELGDLLERYDVDEEDLLSAVEGPPPWRPPLILEDDDHSGGSAESGPTDPGDGQP